MRWLRAALVSALTLVLLACMGPEEACGCQYPEGEEYRIFLLTGFDKDAELVAHEFLADSSADPGEVAVTALLHFTPPADSTQVNGWAPFEEPIAELLSVSQEDGVIVVNLDRDMFDPFPAASLTIVPDGRLTYRQLVRTVHAAYGSDDPVQLNAQGKDARGVWGYPVD